jgi:hypothetical protein
VSFLGLSAGARVGLASAAAPLLAREGLICRR